MKPSGQEKTILAAASALPFGAFEARLPGFDGQWFEKVAFPAFETRATVVYRSATDGAPLICERAASPR